jgi:gluconolactonase
VIKIPEVTANFTWGDDDLKSLYITASTSLYRTRVNVAGPSIS